MAESENRLIIFSKDRAFQLESCLRSLVSCSDKSHFFQNASVLYYASSQVFERQYDVLKSEFPEVKFKNEALEGFHPALMSLLDGSKYVMFGVDDNLYYQQWCIDTLAGILSQNENAIGFSLRLGGNINFCYPHQKPQQAPDFSRDFNGDDPLDSIRIFSWTESELDFGYPLEVSSTLYRSKDIVDRIIDSNQIKNPNELEDLLVGLMDEFRGSKPKLLCFETSRVFACPINIVQTTNDNLAGLNQPFTAEQLGDRFDQGFALDLSLLEDSNWFPISCHQEIPINFVERKHKCAESLHPLVSVIVTCYNYGKYLRDAINSVVAQTYKNIELIIVDGGSDDRFTIDLIAELKSEGRYILQQNSQTHAALNRNLGVNSSRGDFVVCLDADDILQPTFVEKSLLLALHEGVDIVSTSARCFGDSDLVYDVPEFPSIYGILKCNQIHTVALVAKKIWDRVGGMRPLVDDAGRHIHEDWDFWIRCLLDGAKAQNLHKETLFGYRKHGNTSLSQQSGSVPSFDDQKAFLLKLNREAITTCQQRVSFSSSKCLLLGGVENESNAVADSNSFERISVLWCVDVLDDEVFQQLLETITNSDGTPEVMGIYCSSNNLLGYQNYLKLIELFSGRIWAVERLGISFKTPNRLLDNFCRLHQVKTIKLLDDSIDLSKSSLDGVEVIPFSNHKRSPDSSYMERKVVVSIMGLPLETDGVGSEVLFAEVLNDPNASLRGVSLQNQLKGWGWKLEEYPWAPQQWIWSGRDQSKADLALDQNAELWFLQTPQSGRVRIKVGNRYKVYDLRSSEIGYFKISISDVQATGEQVLWKDAFEKLLDVELTPLEHHHPEGLSNEFWLQDLYLKDFSSHFDSLAYQSLPKNWKLVPSGGTANGFAIFGKPGEGLRLKIPEGASIQFLNHAWSGILKVSVEGKESYEVDLYSKDWRTSLIRI